MDHFFKLNIKFVEKLSKLSPEVFLWVFFAWLLALFVLLLLCNLFYSSVYELLLKRFLGTKEPFEILFFCSGFIFQLCECLFTGKLEWSSWVLYSNGQQCVWKSFVLLYHASKQGITKHFLQQFSLDMNDSQDGEMFHHFN